MVVYPERNAILLQFLYRFKVHTPLLVSHLNTCPSEIHTNSNTVALNLVFSCTSVLAFYLWLPVWSRPVKPNYMHVFLLVLHAQSTGQETGCKRPLKSKYTVSSGCISQTICHIANDFQRHFRSYTCPLR
jgi:hypothetical protein